MKTRNINELLIILRDNAKVKDGKICAGLCYELDYLDENLISCYEYDVLNEYLLNNLPKQTPFNRYYCWPKHEWKPRLKWLNKHIKLTAK